MRFRCVNEVLGVRVPPIETVHHLRPAVLAPGPKGEREAQGAAVLGVGRRMRLKQEARSRLWGRSSSKPLPAWPRCSVRTKLPSFLLESANYVSSPCAALDERKDEQDAHGQILQCVREPVRDCVYWRSRAGIRPCEPSEDHREGDQQDHDDQASDANCGEVLQ